MHPAIQEIMVKQQVSLIDAEALLRARAATDAAAAKAVSEIDLARKVERERSTAENRKMAQALGLDLAGVNALVRKLAADPSGLWTWLGRRVQVTIAHARDLEDHE